MKLAWLVWQYEDDTEPRFFTDEPPSYYYRVEQIAYIEIID